MNSTTPHAQPAASRGSTRSTPPQARLFSAPEAARICGVTRNTVHVWIRQGKLAAYRTPGRRHRIHPHDLVVFMRRNGMFVPPALAAISGPQEPPPRKRNERENEPRNTECPPPAREDDAPVGPEWVTLPKAAEYCGVRRYTMWRWVREGRIPAMRHSARAYLVRLDRLTEFMKKNGMFVAPALRERAARSLPCRPSIRRRSAARPDKQIHLLLADGNPISRRFALEAFSDTMRVYQAQSLNDALWLLSLHRRIEIVHLNLETMGEEERAVRAIVQARPDVAIIAVFGDAGRLTEDILAHPLVVPITQKPVTHRVLSVAAAETRARLALSA